MADTILIQHRFTIIDKDGLSFSDALVYPRSVYDTLTSEAIETQKQGRFDAWIVAVNAAKAHIPTKAELEGQLVALDAFASEMAQRMNSIPLERAELVDRILHVDMLIEP